MKPRRVSFSPAPAFEFQFGMWMQADPKRPDAEQVMPALKLHGPNASSNTQLRNGPSVRGRLGWRRRLRPTCGRDQTGGYGKKKCDPGHE
jgi:hypothetical protein